MKTFGICCIGLATLLATTLLTAIETAAAPGSHQRPSEVSDQPRLAWPLRPRPDVVRPFDPPEDPYGSGHRGVDLAAGRGQHVHAAAEGVVVFAGDLAGRGVISIDHDVLRTTYEPVDPAVDAGDQVYAGQRIGEVTASHAGCPEEFCLHWGVRRGDDPPEYVNPLLLVGDRWAVRLKPLEGSLEVDS